MKTIAGCLSIDLPQGDWHAIDIPRGFAFVRTQDYAACGENIEHASFTASIATLSESVEAVMQRRVRQGFPETSSVIVAGAPATRFAYTDGVRTIHSYFARSPSGGIVEIGFATFLDASGAPKVDLESVALEVFDRLEWLP